MAPSSRVPIRYSSAGRDLYARAAKSGGSVLTKRSVPTPTDDERRGTQGACLYACRRGHVWMVFLVRVSEPRGFRLRDPADAYCEEDPCSSGDDQGALGVKVSGTRHWTMR